jgi:tetratricopeptide (TPR) repeat protein
MSIIHDALKKAQEHRSQAKPGVPFENKPEIKKKPNLVLIGGVAACAFAVVAYLYIPAFHKPKVIPVNKLETAKPAVPVPAQAKPAQQTAQASPEKDKASLEVKETLKKEQIPPAAKDKAMKFEPAVGSVPATKSSATAPQAEGRISTAEKGQKTSRALPHSDSYRGPVEDAAIRRMPVLKSEDDWINGQYNEALKLMNSGQSREAQRIFLSILARKPDHVEALNNMGVLSASLGNKKEALTYFKRVLECRSNYPKAYNNLGLLMMSEDAGLAEEYFRKAISLEPDTLEPYLNLSALLRSQKRFAEAAKVLEIPISKNVNDAPLFLSYASVLDHLGQYDDAIRYYRQYLGMAKQARGRNSIIERLHYLEERRKR